MKIEAEKILEKMIDGHVLIDIEGRIISVNSSYCKMSGYSKEELLQLTLHDIQSIDDYKKVKERLENVIKQGFVKFESIHKRKNGSKYPVDVSIDIIFENNRYYFLGTFRDISEKKQLNEKLETSERIFNHSLDMLCIAGFDGYFKVLNPAWEKTLGWSTEEMLEKPWIEFVYPDDIDTTNNVKSVIMDGKEIYQFENRYICKNGDVKWLSWNSFPYPDENIMFGVARDITEGKLAEINLMKSKRLLSQAEEIADMGSWEWDSENDVAYWSDGLFRIFMRSPKEGAPKLAQQSELYEIESYESLKRSVNECLKNGKPYELEMQIIRSDGEIRTCISRGRAEKNQEGKINRLWGTFNDITDRVKMESEIKLRAMQNRTMMETTQDGFWAVDFKGQITDVNEAYCKMTGYSKEELLGMKIGELDVVESPQETAEHIEEIIENGSDLFETRHKKKDGSILNIEVSATLVDQDEVIFVFCRNITNRKNSELKIQQTLTDLLESQRIAQLGTWSLDLDTNQVIWSEELYKMYGFDPTKPPPPYTEHMKLFTQESWEKLSSALEQTRTLGIPYELELELVNKDGLNGWMWVRGEAIKDANGNIVSLHGAAQNITKQKHMEHEIRQSEERFQLLFNKAPLGYQSLDSKGCFIEVNQKWLNTLGYRKEEVIGKWFGDFLCPEYVERFRQRFPLFKDQGHINSEFEMLSKDGQRLTMAFEGKIGNDAEGKFLQTHCILQDITDQRKAEKALIESEERYKALFENAGIGIGYYSKEGIVLSYNRLALKNIGGELEDYIGKSIREIFPKEAAEIYFTRIKKSISSDKPQEYEDCIVFNSVPKWFSSVFTRVMDTTGEILGVQIVSLDITERKMAEDKLLYLNNYDQLTGLYNRRYYDMALKSLDTSENLPLSIIVCDINGLKLINDSFGHDVGDQIIKNVAKAIESACRVEDIIARTGGDEFIAILPMTSVDESLEVAKQMKKRASKESIQNIEVSISFGYDTKERCSQPIVEVIANAENYMYRNKLHESTSMRSKTIDLIMNTLFAKSKREAAHSNRVGNICESIASKMSLDKDAINQMRIAGFIHDIGKIGIDEKILNKPGSLTIDERGEIERHPEIGWRLLSSTKEFSELAQFVLSHHEKWDGSGYPNRLKGEEIPLEARIICVADSYDAMTTDRSYRKGLSKEEAIKELIRCSGTQFDPNIVELFVNQVMADL